MVTPRFLLDTNIISEPTRYAPERRVIQQIREHRGEMAIPSVVWHELLYGCYRLPQSLKRSNLEDYLLQAVLTSIPILAYDDKAATWHAQERSRLVALGRTPPYTDGQIAAIAYVNNLILATRNVAHFVSFDGIRLANWFDDVPTVNGSSAG